MKPTTFHGQSGMTLVEAIIVMFLTTILFGTFSLAVNDAADFSASNLGAANLQDQGRVVIERIRHDINAAGRITDPVFNVAMPQVFTNGVPSSTFTSFLEHDATTLAARAAYFPTAPTYTTPVNPPLFVAPGNESEPMGFREIVMRIPADNDHDGRIVSSTTHAIEWSNELISYILVPTATSTCNLVRRRITQTGNTVDEVICRFVESLTFDTSTTKPILPQNAVEVHLHLYRRNGRGQDQRLHLSTTIAMRNS